MEVDTTKQADTVPRPYDNTRHFSALYDGVPREFAFRATDRAGLSAWQKDFRSRLREVIGLNNMESDLAGYTPKAERLESIDLGSHVRESWHLWVEPTVPLPFYLLLPKGLNAGVGNPDGKDPSHRFPLVLVPHGHNHPHIYAGIARDAKEEAHMLDGERDIARQAAAEEGYITIAPTARAFGETRTEADQESDRMHSCRNQLVHDLLVGRTPIGDRVWDVMRLIDWAVANLPVDTDRIAITGNSGGGTISLFTAACETRISLAMPGCYFCTFVGSIGTIHHCECNYVPGMLRLGEMHDVAGLIAPRPFCAIAGRDDPIFPIEHVKSAFDRLKGIYEVAGAADKCELSIGEGGHRYYKSPAWDFVRRQFGSAA